LDTNVTGHAGSQAPGTSEILDGLNDLLQLDHDAIGAYQIAIDKLQDRDHANQISGFRLDHERHIRELNQLIAELGGTPKNEPHATGPFKQALQSLGGLGGDKGILMAWRTNELQVRTKYDTYASRAVHWPANVKRTIDRNALDEERHYRWVADVLQGMGIGAGENPDLDAMDRKREEANVAGPGLMERAGDMAAGARERASGLVEDARERVGDLSGSARDRAGDLALGARERVAGGLESVANRISGLVEDRQEQGGAAGRAAGVAGTLAGGMGSTARYVRDGNLEDLRGDFEEQVRRSPVQTLLMCAVAGFVVGRILR